MTIRLTLNGVCRVKKNSSVIIRGRSIVLPSHAYQRWFAGVLRLKPGIHASLAKVHLPITQAVEATMIFYRQVNSGDLFGLEQAVADAIQIPVWKCIKTQAHPPSMACGKKTAGERPTHCCHCKNPILKKSRDGLGLLLDDALIVKCTGVVTKDAARPRVEITLQTIEPDQAALF